MSVGSCGVGLFGGPEIPEVGGLEERSAFAEDGVISYSCSDSELEQDTLVLRFYHPTKTHVSSVVKRKVPARAQEKLYITRGVSPDNVNFCQLVIIRNQTYGQYNLTFILPHQKTSIRTKVMDDQKFEKPL